MLNRISAVIFWMAVTVLIVLGILIVSGWAELAHSAVLPKRVQHDCTGTHVVIDSVIATESDTTVYGHFRMEVPSGVRQVRIYCHNDSTVSGSQAWEAQPGWITEDFVHYLPSSVQKVTWQIGTEWETRISTGYTRQALLWYIGR
jgi:hypothetical protein